MRNKMVSCLVLLSMLSGAALAGEKDVPASVQSCSLCHGEQGIAAQLGVPDLAGQKEEYLRRQLLDFRSRVRVHAVMNDIAAPLNDAQIDALALYYNRLPRPAAASARALDPTRPPLVFCVRCHGADGISPNDIWPNLAGQSIAYLEQQLKAYSSDARHDPMMAMWGKMLDEAQVQEVLEYFAALAPRPGSPR